MNVCFFSASSVTIIHLLNLSFSFADSSLYIFSRSSSSNPSDLQYSLNVSKFFIPFSLFGLFSVKSLDGETITEIQKRSEQYQGQTPQSFKFKIIKEAHDYANATNNTETTDDCRLVINIGKEVHLVQGSKLNFKITTFDDLMILKALLKIGKSEVI